MPLSLDSYLLRASAMSSPLLKLIVEETWLSAQWAYIKAESFNWSSIVTFSSVWIGPRSIGISTQKVFYEYASGSLGNPFFYNYVNRLEFAANLTLQM